MTKEYGWRTPWVFPGADPAKVGKELDAFVKNGESIDAEQAVEWARTHKRSELHKCIDWDNDIAAQKWRIHQLRSVVANIRVTTVEGGNVTYERRFINVGGVGYMGRDSIAENEDYSALVLDRARKDLHNWRSRYDEIRGLNSEALDAVDMALDALDAQDAPALAGSVKS